MPYQKNAFADQPKAEGPDHAGCWVSQPEIEKQSSIVMYGKNHSGISSHVPKE
jgi:hypothetical protein